jgi:hypothetical protein
MEEGDHNRAAGTRELDETELDLIVGGVAKAAAARTEIDHLIQQDLAGHDSGQDHTHEIAAMIASGAVSAKVAIHDMEVNAAKDGNHSVDQQLAQVNAVLKQAHATGASSAFALEENNRLGSGAAAADLAHLIAKGASPGAAVTALQDEARVSGSHKLSTALGALETATGGSAEIEQALGGLVRSGQVSAADAIGRVEHAAASAHRSVDEALSHLDDGAGSNKAIHAEELRYGHQHTRVGSRPRRDQGE